MSSNVYCGNNKLNKYLINNTKILGTRYKCLKIGIQKGRSLPVDENYLDPYEPIDTAKIYCGNSDRLENAYDRFGNLPNCLQKGIGIGKKIKAQENRNDSGDSENVNVNFNFKYILLFLIFELSLFLILIITKPKFILKKSKKNEKKINILKFLIIYISVSTFIFFLSLKTLI